MSSKQVRVPPDQVCTTVQTQCTPLISAYTAGLQCMRDNSPDRTRGINEQADIHLLVHFTRASMVPLTHA